VNPGSPGPGACAGAPNSTLRGFVLNVSAARSIERAALLTSSANELTRGSVSLPTRAVTSRSESLMSASAVPACSAAVPALFRFITNGPSGRFRLWISTFVDASALSS
jgi:hypothetical protein